MSLSDYLLTPYIIPSITALVLKAAVLWIAWGSLRQVSLWLWGALIALVGLNAFEITSFVYVDRPDEAVVYLSFYYICALAAALSIMGLALEVTGFPNRFSITVTAFLAISCVIVLFLPNAAFIGAKSIGYSVTRIPGPFYWVIQMTLLISMLSVILLLGWFISVSKDWYARRKAMVTLLATGPMAVAVLGLLLAMQMGYKINGTVVISLAVNIMLAVLFLTENTINREKVLRMLAAIPTTQEYKVINTVKDYIFSTEPVGLKDASAMFEREYIHRTIQSCDGNKTKAAQKLGIGRATLIRKIKQD